MENTGGLFETVAPEEAAVLETLKRGVDANCCGPAWRGAVVCFCVCDCDCGA